MAPRRGPRTGGLIETNSSNSAHHVATGLVAEYGITCEGLPLVDVAATVPEATLEVEFRPSDDRYAAFVVELTDGEPGNVERTFESAAFVEAYVPTRQADGIPRYRVEPAIGMDDQLGEYVDDVAELQALAVTDATIRSIRVTQTGWVRAGWFADRATLDASWSFWDRNGEFTLRRLTSDDRATAPEERLTEPQREAFRAAYEAGYFDIPRSASLTDVAADLNISASSLSERLRRAQTRLAETTVARPDSSDT